MNYTYAEIDDIDSSSSTMKMSCASEEATSSNIYVNSKFLEERRLAIENRYRKRTTPRSDAGYSSGYSSGGSSSSSITTVVNGAAPYRPKPATLNYLATQKNAASIQYDSEQNVKSNEREESIETPQRPCCIQCREKELKAMLEVQYHHYENFENKREKKDTTAEPYVNLMLSVYRNARKEADGKRVHKIQQKIERLLRFDTRPPFYLDHDATFEKQITCFGREVEIRLRAINDVSPETFQDISAKFCDALHSNKSGIKNIVKGIRTFFK